MKDSDASEHSLNNQSLFQSPEIHDDITLQPADRCSDGARASGTVLLKSLRHVDAFENFLSGAASKIEHCDTLNDRLALYSI